MIGTDQNYPFFDVVPLRTTPFRAGPISVLHITLHIVYVAA